MGFRASNVIPGQAYADAKYIAVQVSTQATSFRTKITLGTNAQVIIDYLRDLIVFRDRLQAISQIPGIGEYAQDQEKDVTYNIAAEFNSMLTAINNVINWIGTALPKDESEYLLIYKLTNSGSFMPRSFTSAQIASLLPLLQEIIDAVE